MRASVSSGCPNTEKLMKAQGCRPSAFIVSRLSSWEAHQFKDCLHRVQRLEEQLEFSLQV